MENYDSSAPEMKEAKKSKFALWIENFFYHYKWYVIAAVFVIAVITVCTVQLCQRESYDALILYAGGKQIGKTGADGETAEYVTVNKAIKTEMKDYDGNGEIMLGLETFFWLSAEEIRELEATKLPTEEIPYGTIMTNKESIDSMLLYSDYFVWFISDDLYEEYYEADESRMRFVVIEGLVEDGSEVEFYVNKSGVTDKHAIRLASTELYELPGVKDLPEDTLIVLRKLGTGANKSTERAYENAQDIIRNIAN
ncbi:MAG: hypothetical protein IJ515_01280 [Clostridia bacterium]|nr:hypothetical protein [Clostridia bacterium]